MKSFCLSLILLLVIHLVSSKPLKSVKPRATNIHLNPADWVRGAPPFRNMNSSKPIDQERIINGMKADFGKFSFMASLWYKDKQHYCGGTVLNDITILTAAHCVLGPQKKGIVATDIFAHVGSTVNDGSDGGYIIGVKDWGTDPDFDIEKLGDGHDLGVMILDTPINFDEQTTVGKVCLPEGANDSPKVNECIVMGWGYMNPDGSDASTVLMEAATPILPPETCAAHISDVNMDQLLCAGYVEGGKDACMGDSGGPLMCHTSIDDSWVQYGIVSWGRGCAVTFGFYTKIVPNLEYISKAAGV